MTRLNVFDPLLIMAGLLAIVSAASLWVVPQTGRTQVSTPHFCRFAHTPKSPQHAIYAPVCGPHRH